MKIFIGFLISAFFGCVSAETANSLTLACVGDYRHVRDKIEQKLANVIVKTSKDSILISGIPGLAVSGEEYRVTRRSEDYIFFNNGSNFNYQGNLNRFTGAIKIIEIDAKLSRWFQSFDGTCRVAQKLF